MTEWVSPGARAVFRIIPFWPWGRSTTSRLVIAQKFQDSPWFRGVHILGRKKKNTTCLKRQTPRV